MLETTVTISGKTMEDIEFVLEEVKRLIGQGFTSGMNGNDSGDFSFSTSGEAEEEEDEAETYEE